MKLCPNCLCRNPDYVTMCEVCGTSLEKAPYLNGIYDDMPPPPPKKKSFLDKLRNLFKR